MGWTCARRLSQAHFLDRLSRSGIRDYSGTATYTRDFDLPKTLPSRVVLDLGTVDVIASLTVNGTEFW